METKKKFSPVRDFIHGIIIGLGAILPGISGGVLSVTYGIYRPLMEVIAGPKAILKYWKLFLAVGIGWLAGFFGGAGAVSAIFEKYEIEATCLFIGMILGSVPTLWRESGEQGRSKKDIVIMFISMILFMAPFVIAGQGNLPQIAPSLGAFLFCGALWGLSLIVPGMSSSPILMATGLLIPLTEGIAVLAPNVVIPWAIGIAAVAIMLGRLVNRLFERHYAPMYHAVIGIVLASTLAVIPLNYASVKEFLLCLASLIVGAVVTLLADILPNRAIQKGEKE